jgi:hypothetical protein
MSTQKTEVFDSADAQAGGLIRKGEATMKPSSSGNTYMVGCKLPFGIIMEMGKRGGKENPYRSFKLQGASTSRVIGGFGITEGVPADFYDAWEAAMKGRDMFTNGLVFKVKKGDVASAKDMAKTLIDQRTGLEKLDPRKLKEDPRVEADVAADVTKRTND